MCLVSYSWLMQRNLIRTKVIRNLLRPGFKSHSLHEVPPPPLRNYNKTNMQKLTSGKEKLRFFFFCSFLTRREQIDSRLFYYRKRVASIAIRHLSSQKNKKKVNQSREQVQKNIAQNVARKRTANCPLSLSCKLL